MNIKEENDFLEVKKVHEEKDASVLKNKVLNLASRFVPKALHFLFMSQRDILTEQFPVSPGLGEGERPTIRVC